VVRSFDPFDRSDWIGMYVDWLLLAVVLWRGVAWSLIW
jgi:hypothetical protein